MRYEHVQDVASDVWNITHNMNALPVVDVFFIDRFGKLSKLIPMEVKCTTLNTMSIHFAAPRVGKAILSS